MVSPALPTLLVQSFLKVRGQIAEVKPCWRADKEGQAFLFRFVSGYPAEKRFGPGVPGVFQYSAGTHGSFKSFGDDTGSSLCQ